MLLVFIFILLLATAAGGHDADTNRGRTNQPAGRLSDRVHAVASAVCVSAYTGTRASWL